MKRLASARISVAAVLVAAGSPFAQDEDPQSFALPLTRDAQTRAKTARDHLDAGRFSQGIFELQRLLEEHDGEVLPDEYRHPERFSAHDAHPGAAAWARRELLELPQEARAAYGERYEPRARAALAAARAAADRKALVEVARRYPLCPSAARAWLNLGDLELEEGHPENALLAWARAEGLARVTGDDVLPTAPRRRLANALLADADGPPSPDPTLARTPIPKSGAEVWSTQLDLSPFPRTSYPYTMFPVLAGDTVLVSSTLRLYALDAFTGEIEWTAGPPRGWDRLQDAKRRGLFEAINWKQILVAPAAGGRIAVAALQIPYSEEPNEAWQGIEILKPIPQRRLYAFDLETGEELWNHAPELEWNPDQGQFDWSGRGDFAGHMMVAAPPVVFGSRLLVPCYRMQGRIDYHVACYELETGERLWSTNVVSGQRATNMFGRAMLEFVGSPLVVAGDRVIAQTELGTVAALDLFTGEILWSSLYRQSELKKTHHVRQQPPSYVWRVAPPALVGEICVATPSDSPDIAGFHLEDGRVLWTYSQRKLKELDRASESAEFDLLLGADEDTVYLGGEKVSALTKPGGLHSPAMFDPRWTQSFENMRRSRSLLCRDAVLVPVGNRRVALDRRSGVELTAESTSWESVQFGNLLVEGGVLYSLSFDALHGFFDWTALFERQEKRLASRPDDPEVALEAAALSTRRAEVLLETGETFESLARLREARELLQPLREDPTRAGGLSARIDEALFAALGLEARVLDDQGHGARALETLAEARSLAVSREDLLEVLLLAEGILRGSSKRAEHLAVLGELEERCGNLTLPVDVLLVDAAPLFGDLILSRTVPRASLVAANVPVGTWALLTRAAAHKRAREVGLAMADWHEVVARYDEVELGSGITAGAVARNRIGAELRLPDGRRHYQPFEQEAARLYARALENGSPGLLADVERRFPHARAALDALRARLEQAYASDDAEAVAEICRATLARGGGDDAEERAVLLLLGRLLGRRGNVVFERELVLQLAREAPAEVSELAAHEGRSMAELASELASEYPDPLAPLPRFDANVSPTSNPPRGPHLFVGKLLPPRQPSESAPAEIHIYLAPASGEVSAYSSEAPWEARWRQWINGRLSSQTADVSADRVVIGTDHTVFGLDARGERVWTRELPGAPISSITCGSGVVIVVTGETKQNGPPPVAHALEVQDGIPLWEFHLGGHGWRRPVLGEGRVAFFQVRHPNPVGIRIVDLFRGTETTAFEVDRSFSARLDETSWIEHGTLLVPEFTRRESGVAAYDLETGLERWSRWLEGGEDFHSIAQHDGKTYFLTVTTKTNASGGVYELDTEFGHIRRVMPLGVGEEPIGLPRKGRTELETPHLFTYVKDARGRNGVPVRAIHLGLASRWTWSLPVKNLYVSNTGWPRPAVSSSCVALAFITENPSTRLQDDAKVVFLDKETGAMLDTYLLPESMARAEKLELRGLGESLFVVGSGTVGVGLRMEVLEGTKPKENR